MRGAALEALARHRVAELRAARHHAAAQLQAIRSTIAALEGRISWWDRVDVLSETADEAALARARAEEPRAAGALEAASRALASAELAASAEVPPLEVALRVEGLVATALAGRAGAGGPEDAQLAEALSALAARIVEIWAPGLDAQGLVARLADDAERARLAAAPLPPPARDERLGFAPEPPDEVAARAAAALSAGGFAHLRARVRRDAGQHAALAARLRELRKQLGPLDLALGRNVREHHEETRLEAALLAEERELIASIETEQHAILGALGAFPPLAVALAAQVAAGVLRARLRGAERVVDPTGALVSRPSAAPRALLLAALVELRAALERAFPTLGALAGGRGGARDAEDLARAARVLGAAGGAGPYRRPVADGGSAPPPPVRLIDAERELGARVDALGAQQIRDRALAHAGMLGVLEGFRAGAAGRIGLLDRLAFWSDSEDERQDERLAHRARWHRGFADVLLAQALGAVARAAPGIFALDLRDALVRAHRAVESLSTRSGSSSSSMSCPVFHHGEAIAAIDAVAAVLGGAWGLSGAKEDLADGIEDLLRRGPPPPPPAGPPRPLDRAEIVVLAASSLAGAELPAARDRARQLHAAHAAAVRAAAEAGARVGLWDKVDVLRRSPAEEARDAAVARMQALSGERAALDADIARALDRAISRYPPAPLFFALAVVRARVEAVRAVLRRSTSTHRVGNTTRTVTTYRCEIVGRSEALSALRDWTRRAVATFGSMPPDGDLLARHWGRALAT